MASPDRTSCSSWLKMDTEVLVLNDALGGPRRCARCSLFTKSWLAEASHVSRCHGSRTRPMPLPEALSALASRQHLRQGGRGVGGVQSGLGERVLVVVEDRRRDGEGERPLHAVHLPVGERAGQVVAGRVLGRVHARLHGEERAGVDGGLGALVLELDDVGQLAVGEAGQVLLPGVVVARLGDQGDVDLGLRRVEGVGDRLQRGQVGLARRTPRR